MDIRELRPPVEDGPWPPITHHPPLSTAGLQGATSWTGLSYALVDGYRPMVLDIHVPQTNSPAPVVVWVHGGGWASGDRRLVPLQWGQQRLFQRIVDAGFALATPDYRLVAEAPPEAAVHDLVAAVRYLRRYAAELRLDPDRIGLWGDSAGAHLATVAGLAGSAPEPDLALLGDLGVGTGRADVAAIVYWYGASDLTVLADLLAFLWPHVEPTERAARGRRLSPVTHLRTDSPPLLVMQGDHDTISPVEQAIRLHDAARRVGARSELTVVPGAEHAFLGAAIEPLWDRAIDFLAASCGVDRVGQCPTR